MKLVTLKVEIQILKMAPMKIMNKVKVLTALTLVFFASSFSSNKVEKPMSDVSVDFKHITLTEAKALAKESGKMIFVDAYADWCGPCKRMTKTSFADAEVAEYLNGQFINVKANVEDEKGEDFVNNYNIQAMPTLLILDKEGNLKQKSVGYLDAKAVLKFAQKADN